MKKSEYEDKLRREVQDIFNAKYCKTCFSLHIYFHICKMSVQEYKTNSKCKSPKKITINCILFGLVSVKLNQATSVCNI